MQIINIHDLASIPKNTHFCDVHLKDLLRMIHICNSIRSTTVSILIKRAEYFFYKEQNLLLLRANDSVPTEAF